MRKRRPRNVYEVVPVKDGTFGVRDKSTGPAALTISGFKTEQQAKEWIDAQLSDNIDESS